MKIEPDKRQMTRALYTFLALAGTIVFALLMVNLGKIFAGAKAIFGYLAPIVIAFVIAFLLNPMMKLYENKLLSRIKWNKKQKKDTKSKKTERIGMKPKTKRILSLLMTYLTVIMFLFLFIWIVVPSVNHSLANIASQIPGYIASVQKGYNGLIDWFRDLPAVDAQGATELVEKIISGVVIKLEEVLSNLGTIMTDLANGVFVVAGTVASTLLNVVLGFIFSIYFLLDKERLFAQLRKIVKALFPEKVEGFLYDFAKDTHKIFNGFIVGNVISSLIVGAITFIFMLFVHRELAVLVAVIIGITNMIPYFGPFIGAIPSGLLLLSVSPPKTVIFVIFILILQQVDGNIVVPRILGETTGLSPLLVVLAIFLFTGLLGPVGVFLGVPLFSMIYSIIKRFITYLLKRKNYSIETKDYDSEANPYME